MATMKTGLGDMQRLLTDIISNGLCSIFGLGLEIILWVSRMGPKQLQKHIG